MYELHFRFIDGEGNPVTEGSDLIVTDTRVTLDTNDLQEPRCTITYTVITA